MMRRISCTCSIGLPSRPECSLTEVSFQRPRALSQKMAAMTTSRPSPVALRVLRHLGTGLGVAKRQFVFIVLAQRLRIDTEHPGNVRLRNTIACQRLYLTAMKSIGLMANSARSRSSAGCTWR